MEIEFKIKDAQCNSSQILSAPSSQSQAAAPGPEQLNPERKKRKKRQKDPEASAKQQDGKKPN